MADFNKGDTVRLKSGGPLMTVQDIGDYGPTGPTDGIRCVWFEGSQRQEAVFDKAVLAQSDNRIRTMRIQRG